MYKIFLIYFVNVLIICNSKCFAAILIKSTLNFIEEQGYQGEVINLETEDFYGLTMFYIKPERSKCHILKSAVLLMHGHSMTSDGWVMQGSKHSLALDLVEHCHPVYLGNARSNIYSQRHKTLSIDLSEFWNFSYDEIGYYDLAAMIDYIFPKHSGLPVHYVGHSQGCAEILILLSDRKQYRSKVGIVFLLAPATYFGNTKTLFFIVPRLLLGCGNEGAKQFNGNWLQKSYLTQIMGQEVCSVLSHLCNFIVQLIAGKSKETLNFIPNAAINHPAGNSVRELKHLTQGYCSREYDFTRYNYGPQENMKKYQQPIPPPYNIEDIPNDIVIYYGTRDTITVPQDVKSLIRRLKKSTKVIRLRGYNHFDLILGKNIHRDINLKIVNMLK